MATVYGNILKCAVTDGLEGEDKRRMESAAPRFARIMAGCEPLDVEPREPAVVEPNLEGPVCGGPVPGMLEDDDPSDLVLDGSATISSVDDMVCGDPAMRDDVTASTGTTPGGTLMCDDSGWNKASSNTEANIGPAVEGITWLSSGRNVNTTCSGLQDTSGWSKRHSEMSDRGLVAPKGVVDSVDDSLGACKEHISKMCWQQRMAQREVEEGAPGGY
ncbi:hypothetical protein SARC_07123 [Sphaeroforma arctica JP610]|uniref:Uncharacterized protein n=1 Tax=Sphaeroforma arctica JP610 TaxID=667725 RepID=A0A0L0FUK8_9EUKA|nr:hypothetical protein SARC_07123 [Sphaeroforma arctica JP610]KNC80517.1 hypothetical protein SARC_07123 [Sphaeroforma arctica JP610]|eukprot:XP_014154419.1 hypothetical protein SARC_07123 [Sphaeroforma arctica JP610]